MRKAFLMEPLAKVSSPSVFIGDPGFKVIENQWIPAQKLCGKDKKKSFTKTSIVALVIFIFPFSANAAEIYHWTDDDGVVHITDDRSNIPDKYWEEERVKKEAITPSQNDTQPVAPEPAQRYKEGDTGEIFGDYPLEWWIDKFRDLRKDIADSQESLDREKNFVTVFDEGGRRYPRKIYTKEEIAQYEDYKKEISPLEEKLKNLKSELVELQRKATIYGVPRNIRE